MMCVKARSLIMEPTADVRVISVKIPRAIFRQMRSYAGRSEQTNAEVITRALVMLLAEEQVSENPQATA